MLVALGDVDPFGCGVSVGLGFRAQRFRLRLCFCWDTSLGALRCKVRLYKIRGVSALHQFG